MKENYTPEPIEFLHASLMEAFHELRNKKGDNQEKTVTLDGIEFNGLIAHVKTLVYNKYPEIKGYNLLLDRYYEMKGKEIHGKLREMVSISKGSPLTP